MTNEKKDNLAQPKTIEGIEFYVSNDGTQSGMSASGLAKFIGIDKKTVLNLIDKIENASGNTDNEKERNDEASSLEDLAEAFSGTVFDRGIRGAKVIPSVLCESIIYYYAYSSTNVSVEVSSQAKSAHRKFARYGLHKFILQATGFVESNDVSELKNLMQEILGEIKDHKERSLKYQAIRQSTLHMPGYDQLLDTLGSEDYQDNLLAPAEDGSLSIEGWLHKKGITLSKTKFLSLTKSAAANYKAATRQEPVKKHFKLPDGSKKYNVFVYRPEYFPILQMCLEEVMRRS